MATRPGKPKDKPDVDISVRLTYYRVYAPLRSQIFHSLVELNKAMLEKVNALNITSFQNKEHSAEASLKASKSCSSALYQTF